MRRWLISLLLCLLLPAVAGAGWLYVFADGDAMSRTWLNADFNHMHSVMVGGHGERLLDADVSPSAGLQFSKFASPGLFPKAWAMMDMCATTAANTDCPVRGGYGIRGVSSESAADGVYVGCLDRPITTLVSTPYNAYRAVSIATAVGGTICTSSGIINYPVTTTIKGATCPVGQTFVVLCYVPPGFGGVDAQFQIVFFGDAP